MDQSTRTNQFSRAGLLLACAGVMYASIASAVVAQPVPRPVPPQAAPAPTPNQLRYETMQKMMRPITIEFEGNRLEDVLDFFEEVAGIQIDAKWLNDRSVTGLDKDFEINLKVENMPVVNALERVLDRTLEDETDIPTWQLTNWGEVEVGPRSRLNARKYVLIYPVQDLLLTIPDYSNVPNLNIDDVLDQGGQGGGGGGGIFDDPQRDPAPGSTEREEVERLVAIIQTFVEEDQWAANGGNGGTIRYYRGSLVIRGADYMHRALSGYNFPVPEEYRPYKRPEPRQKPTPSPSNPAPPSR